ncbi:O-methylsterigmatocystin oxidoreductase [Termitomyces sp. T112]|nr:O-methylsterigmatocystin oxidoreductase [Termitomyces sp. T112]
MEPWKLYDSWAHDYKSPLISFRVYSHRTVVINDVDALRDLLEKRGNIYSDRPKLPMFHDVCGRGKTVFNISSLDNRHMQYRRLLRTGLSARATQEYWPLLQSELEILLHGFAANPKEFENHIRRNVTAVIMKMAFGYTVTKDDLFIKVIEETSRLSGLAMAPGRWLVDYFPIMRYIPSFFPGAGWKRQGEAWGEKMNALSEVPHDWVKKQMETGEFIESFTSRHLRPNGEDMVDAEQEDIVKWCAGGLYAGAGDTTLSALLSFIMLMALYPSVQTKAQAELDAMVGKGHVFHLSDLSKLEYLPAVMKEVLRYAPVANLALPHRVTRDDEYKGYRIPKGATIIANVWAILHDPDLYPDPYTFDPERFVSPQPTSLSKSRQPDPKTYVFGFGGRRCPGVIFAETTMLLTMAGILSNFHISLPSREPLPTLQFTRGITSHIKLFNVTISSRT